MGELQLLWLKLHSLKAAASARAALLGSHRDEKGCMEHAARTVPLSSVVLLFSSPKFCLCSC